MKEKKDWIKEAKIIAKENGGKCLSDNCATTKSRVRLRCAKGHEWTAFFGNLKYKKQWCKKCASMLQRNTLRDALRLAKIKKGECLSQNYTKNNAKLKWKCKNNHIFYASYNKISQGRWCPYCSKKVKHTIEKAKQLANERNGKCLSSKYVNNKTKLRWQCENGHIWEAVFNNIKNHGKWCPTCAANKLKKYKIKDLRNYANFMDGECLSHNYTNYVTKYKWQCKNKHTWDATWVSVKNGTWCPKCRRVSQTMLLKIIKKIYKDYNVYNDYKKFKWLKNDDTNGIQSIDIFVDEIKLAIEYDGQGHFFPVNFGGCDDKKALEIFNITKQRDQIKEEKILKNEKDILFFVRFNYTEPIKNIEYVKNKLSTNNVPVEEDNNGLN